VTDDEERLRHGFAKLREDDARRAPGFDELVKKGPPKTKRSPWALVVPLASAAAAAAVFLLWCNMQSMSASAPTAAAPAQGQAGQADQPAAIEDGKQAAAAHAARPVRVNDPEPLGFLLALPGSDAPQGSTGLDTTFLLNERASR
jgi:hypothetical protein